MCAKKREADLSWEGLGGCVSQYAARSVGRSSSKDLRSGVFSVGLLIWESLDGKVWRQHRCCCC